MRQIGGIFVSYRREDTRHIAGRLADALAGRFGLDQVFMDVDSIEPGLDFAEAIRSAVSQCDALIALIGPGWLDAKDADGRRRLDDEYDFVTLEITAALERGVRVVPVLVDGAELPRRALLPAALEPLLRRHALRLDHESFRTGTSQLLDVLERLVARGAASPKPTAAKGFSPPPSAPEASPSDPSPGGLAELTWTATPSAEGRTTRTFQLVRGGEHFAVHYQNKMSWEFVSVDGREVASHRSWSTQSAGLSFTLGSPPSTVKFMASVGYLGKITGLHVFADDVLLYTDQDLPEVNHELEQSLGSEPLALSRKLERFGYYAHIFVAPRIPPERLTRARTALDLPEDVAIVAYVDLNVGGSATACLAFLEDHLAHRNATSKVVVPRTTARGAALSSTTSLIVRTVSVGPTTLTLAGLGTEASVVEDMIDVWRRPT